MVCIEKCSVPEDNQIFAKTYEFSVHTEVLYGERGDFRPCVPGRSSGTLKKHFLVQPIAEILLRLKTHKFSKTTSQLQNYVRSEVERNCTEQGGCVKSYQAYL